MDIETVIGCFREARLGRRMTAGLEAANGLSAMLAGPAAGHDARRNLSLSSVRDPPLWTPAGVGLALRRARLNGVLCRAAGSAVCSLDGQPPGASIRGAFEAVAADPRERGYGLPCCCFGLAFFGLGGRAGRGADAEPGPRDGAVADRVGQRPGEGIVIMPPATRLPLCTQIALFCLACPHRPRHRAGCVSCWLQDREKS